jgi:SAM-dependent methyltransferase
MILRAHATPVRSRPGGHRDRLGPIRLAQGKRRLHDGVMPTAGGSASELSNTGHAPIHDRYLTETRAFFARRAATWDAKFGDDLPAYCAAVAEAGIRRGGVVIDIGCGTGRALPPLREAVGPAGAVIALDVTPEMLDAARPAARLAAASVVIADARVLPFADGSADAIFAAGLVNHLPDPEAGLRELGRVTSPGGPCGASRQARPYAFPRRATLRGPATPVHGGHRLGADGLRRRARPLLRGRRTPLAADSGRLSTLCGAQTSTMSFGTRAADCGRHHAATSRATIQGETRFRSG